MLGELRPAPLPSFASFPMDVHLSQTAMHDSSAGSSRPVDESNTTSLQRNSSSTTMGRSESATSLHRRSESSTNLPLKSALKKTSSGVSLSDLGQPSEPTPIPVADGQGAHLQEPRHVHWGVSPPKRTRSAVAISSSVSNFPPGVIPKSSSATNLRPYSSSGFAFTAMTPVPTFTKKRQTVHVPTLATIPATPQSPSVLMQQPLIMNTLFEWNYGGTSVYLTGEFDNWGISIPMRPVPRHNGESVFSAKIDLDRSKQWMFKFVVDGVWRCSYDYPTTSETGGFVNNVLKPIEDTPLTSSGSFTYGWNRSPKAIFNTGDSSSDEDEELYHMDF
ncbi:hypothetical protein BJ742DRAFT_836208 [Cladochytrium replicatum]|nr:hypothetical protein BJ742DRAFT_836208 [Cladochytrium replicatum]